MKRIAAILSIVICGLLFATGVQAAPQRPDSTRQLLNRPRPFHLKSLNHPVTGITAALNELTRQIDQYCSITANESLVREVSRISKTLKKPKLHIIGVRDCKIQGVVSADRPALWDARTKKFKLVIYPHLDVTQETRRPVGSAILLVDTSGSMQGEKISDAKAGAIKAARTLVARNVAVAVLSFAGDCDAPIRQFLAFSLDADAITSFIIQLKVGGATPLAPALLAAARAMRSSRPATSKSELVIVLADGANSCGDLDGTLDALQRERVLFRHETIGLRVESHAAEQLRTLASRSGGAYHDAASGSEVESAFLQSVDSMALLNLLGTFGEPARQSERKNEASKPAPRWDLLK